VRIQPVDPFTGRPLGQARTIPETRRSRVDRDGFDRSPIPDGDPETVLAWVGYDPDRAKAALVAEHSRGNPNTDLLRRLQERTG